MCSGKLKAGLREAEEEHGMKESGEETVEQTCVSCEKKYGGSVIPFPPGTRLVFHQESLVIHPLQSRKQTEHAVKNLRNSKIFLMASLRARLRMLCEHGSDLQETMLCCFTFASSSSYE